MKKLFNKLFSHWEPSLVGINSFGNSEILNNNRCLRMSQNSGQERRTVEAGRRRRTDSAPQGGRERAEPPQRREGSSGRTGFGGLGSGGGSGLNLPKGKGCLGGGGVIIVIIILAIVFGLQYCGGDTETPEGSSPFPTTNTPSGFSGVGQLSGVASADPFATNYPSLAVTTPAKTNQTWLVMLYQDADDQVLEKDICLDLNEAEKAGSSDRVKVVAQVDRYSGGYTGDTNWTGTKRFLLTQDDNLQILKSQQIADLGELNMSAGQTLIDFATWAIQTYPADKYALILSDHGMGWPGGWTDPIPKGSVDSSIPMAARLGDMLYLNEMDDALTQIRAITKLDKFEVIGLDACLMAQQEVFTALEPHARYAVASEETEPSVGWAYTDFLRTLIRNPDMSGAQLSRAIVEGYIQADQSMQDSSAKDDFLSSSSPFGGLFGQSSGVSADQMARELGQSSTLTAVDLGKIGPLNNSLNNLSFIFQSVNQKTIASSRSYAQSYTSVFGQEVPASYIDLGNFLQIVKQNSTAGEVTQAVDGVLTAIKNAVIAEKHGQQKPGSTGISIYFPNSQLYQNAVAGARSYTAIANRFAALSLWDDFLGYHYANQKFLSTDTQPVVPPGNAIRAPAAGGISVTPVQPSADEVSVGEMVTLKSNITGDNVGHIYLFVGYYDKAANSILVADQDYLESRDTRQVNGVYYPDWGDNDFELKFDWEPVVFAINDGSTTAVSLFNPLDYGRTAEEAIYTVDGTYTFASSGEQLTARLYFVNGLLRQVYGFTGQTDASAPREIIPEAGDKFTILEKWLDLDSTGKVSATAYQEGSTLTFSNQMFTWKTLDAASGEYAVGFIVEDLDGNQQETLTRITVR